MRVLVTGGTGFLGSHLVAALRQRGYEVVCLVRRKIRWEDAGITCHFVDLELPEDLARCLKSESSCDAVVHFGAAMPDNAKDVSPYLAANVTATALLLEAAVDWQVKSIVFASGVTVVGTPSGALVREEDVGIPQHSYILSKKLAEDTCEFYRHTKTVMATSLRITSPYGPGMMPNRVLPRFVNAALSSREITLLGTGSRTQNFVHSSDVVQAVLLALETDKPGVYNVAGRSSVSMLDLARTVVSCVPDCNSKIIFADKPDPQEHIRWEVDGSKAERELGFKASVGLAEGISAYVESLNRSDFHRWWTPCD